MAAFRLGTLESKKFTYEIYHKKNEKVLILNSTDISLKYEKNDAICCKIICNKKTTLFSAIKY